VCAAGALAGAAPGQQGGRLCSRPGACSGKQTCDGSLGPPCSRVAGSMAMERWGAGAGGEGLCVCSAMRAPMRGAEVSPRAVRAGSVWTGSPLASKASSRRPPRAWCATYRGGVTGEQYCSLSRLRATCLPYSLGRQRCGPAVDAMPCACLNLLSETALCLQRRPSPVCEQRAAVLLQAKDCDSHGCQ